MPSRPPLRDAPSTPDNGNNTKWAPNHRVPLLMYGMLLVCAALSMYLFGVFMAVPRRLLGGGQTLLTINEWLVWYSGVPLMLGVCLALVDLLVLFRNKRSLLPDVRYDPITKLHVIIALTA